MNLYMICFPLSVLLLIGAVWVNFRFFNGSFKQRTDLPFQPAYLLGMGLFLAASCAILIPVYAYGSDLNRFQTVIAAFSSALQEFTINLGAADLFEMTGENIWLQIYLAFFIVFSPVLTVGALLSLMKDFFAIMRLKAVRSRGDIKIYVFSELNPESAALAESIQKEEYRELQKKNEGFSENQLCKELKKRVQLVFCDVRPSNEKAPSELIECAQSINATILKKDISLLDLFCHVDRVKTNGILRGKREFFIIGSNQTENTEHMIKLNEKCREYSNYSVILFSSSPTDGYILDTIDKGKHTLNGEFETKISETDKAAKANEADKSAGNATDTKSASKQSKLKTFFSELEKENQKFEEERREECQRRIAQEKHAEDGAPTHKQEEENNQKRGKAAGWFDNCYYIRRVDPINELAVRTLSNDDLISELFTRDKKNRTISVMIVGLGRYGEAFLKNVFWLYQIFGYRLCISVIDVADIKTMKAKIHRMMPDVAEKLCKDENDTCLCYKSITDPETGDCNYQIRVYPSINCESPDFGELFRWDREVTEEDAEAHKVLCGTQMVFVTLGDDNKNIDVAVKLRRHFDKINRVDSKEQKNKPDEMPLIYSVVFDDKTVRNLNSSSTRKGIVDYKAIPYHIRFVGQLSNQYNYAYLKTLREKENRALFRHFEWVMHEASMSKCYHMIPDDTDDILANMLNDFKAKIEEYFGKTSEELAGWTQETIYKGQSAESILGALFQYTDFEYYRNSSIARAIHQEMMIGNLDSYFDSLDSRNHRDIKICTCERCVARKKTEHIRWNAYMRADGYRFNEKRNDRAKLHNDLIPWEELNIIERHKD